MTIAKQIKDHIEVITKVHASMQKQIEQFADLCQDALDNGHTLFFMGNGGSAADCQHLAAEFVVRFKRERKGLAAIALTTDTSILTAGGNDYGFETIFARQIEALVRKGDVVVGISTSGNSPNIVNGFAVAKEIGAVTIGMTGGKDSKMSTLCDLCLKVPSDITARIQEAHIMIGHIVCDLVDEVYANV